MGVLYSEELILLDRNYLSDARFKSCIGNILLSCMFLYGEKQIFRTLDNNKK